MKPFLRGVLAIAAGHALFTASELALFAIAGEDPNRPARPSFLILSTGAGIVFALIGGYLTAATAGRRPFLHAAILSTLLALEAFGAIVARSRGSAIWPPLATILLIAPSAALGGWIRAVRSPASRAVAGS